MNTGSESISIITTEEQTCDNKLATVTVDVTLNCCSSSEGGGGSTPVTDRHNDLLGLQGGTPTERYHLTQAQYESLGGGGAGNLQAVLTVGNTADKAIQLTNNTESNPPGIDIPANKGVWFESRDYDGGTTGSMRLINPFGESSIEGKAVSISMQINDFSAPNSLIILRTGFGSLTIKDPNTTSNLNIGAEFSHRVQGVPAEQANELATLGQIATIVQGAIATGQTIGANTTGNAATVTNGVVTTGSYINPNWITSLAYSKITGAPAASTLQSVTNGSGNNITSNCIQVTGLGNINSAIDSTILIDDATGGGLIRISNAIPTGSVGLKDNLSDLRWQSPTNITSSITVREESLLNAGAVINKRLQIEDALNNNEAITLGQVNTLITAIPTTNLQSTLTAGNTANKPIILTNVASNPPAVEGLQSYFQLGDGFGTGTIEARETTVSDGSAKINLTGIGNSAEMSFVIENSTDAYTPLKLVDPLTNGGSMAIMGRTKGSAAVLSNEYPIFSQVIENQVGSAQTANFRITGTGFFGADNLDNNNEVNESGMITKSTPFECLRYVHATQFNDATNSGTYSAQAITFTNSPSSPTKTISLRHGFSATPNGSYDVTLPSASGQLALVGQIPTSFSLQTVTTGSGNNRTSNMMGVTGSSNSSLATDGLYMLHVPGGSQASLVKSVSNVVKNSLDFTPTKTELLYIGTTTGHFTLRDENSGQSGAKLDTRLEISDALNSTEAITLSQLTSGLGGKQATLVSGTNIKTVNGTTLLGNGDIAITVDTSTLVPYTGATTNVNLGSNTITSSGGFIGNASTATTAGTVTTPAQPNITSVGTLTGLTVTAPITGSITGNAATVTNGVVTTASYADPSWITSLAWAKITGAPTIPVDANLLHLTGNETKTGRLTLATPAAAAGAAGLSPLIATGGKAGANTATTGTVTSGTAANINLTAGAGGDITGITSGTALSGSGGKVNLTGGDGGNTLGTPTTSFPGSGGDAVIQGGGSYGGVAGTGQLKAGNNYTAGGFGGDIFIVAGWGNNSSADNPTYNGTMWMGYSPGGTTRGNVVIGATLDDRVNRLQVTGDSLFTGKAYVTVAPTVATGVMRLGDMSDYLDKISLQTFTGSKVLDDTANSGETISIGAGSASSAGAGLTVSTSSADYTSISASSIVINTGTFGVGDIERTILGVNALTFTTGVGTKKTVFRSTPVPINDNLITLPDNTGTVALTLDIAAAVSDKISNATDTYGAKITNVISLSQAEYDAIGTKNANTLYVIV